MSRTYKDEPYRIRVKKRGVIDHDHINTDCVVGTSAEMFQRFRDRSKHEESGNCARMVYTKDCIHSAERERYQKDVDTARSGDRAYFAPIWINPLTDNIRRPAIKAMKRMLSAGFFPNCDQIKTHERDISEVDLNLRPGERIYGVNIPYRYTYGNLDHIALIDPAYDESIPCPTCDALPPITCLRMSRREDNSRNCCSKACSWCYNPEKDARSARSYMRDKLRRAGELYNTFGDSVE